MKIVMRARRGHRSIFALQGVAKMSKLFMVAIALAIAATPTLASDDNIPTVSFDEGAIGVEDVVPWTSKSMPDVKPATDAEAGDAAMFFLAASPNSEAVSEMLSWRWRVQSRFRPRRA
jgi:hypothetical protein